MEYMFYNIPEECSKNFTVCHNASLAGNQTDNAYFAASKCFTVGVKQHEKMSVMQKNC